MNNFLASLAAFFNGGWGEFSRWSCRLAADVCGLGDRLTPMPGCGRSAELFPPGIQQRLAIVGRLLELMRSKIQHSKKLKVEVRVEVRKPPTSLARWERRRSSEVLSEPAPGSSLNLISQDTDTLFSAGKRQRPGDPLNRRPSQPTRENDCAAAKINNHPGALHRLGLRSRDSMSLNVSLSAAEVTPTPTPASTLRNLLEWSITAQTSWN